MLYILIIILSIIILLALAMKLASPKPAPPYRYLTPQAGRSYRHPEQWKGIPVDSKNRFVNEEYPYYQDYLTVMRWAPSHLKSLWRNRSFVFPVKPLAHRDALFRHTDSITWLGHASFLIRMNGVSILIDPQFYHLTSLYKRHSVLPIDPNWLTGIDYLLLSHDHADHLDKESLTVVLKNNPQTTVLTSLGMEKQLRKYFPAMTQPIHTAGWYEQYPLPAGLAIWFVPSRHYGKRVDNKFNEILWGGFIIQRHRSDGQPQTIYYEGDSGYGAHFKEIGKLFQPDIAIMGIGAYQPLWFMHPNHMSPEEAVKAFTDTGASVFIPMHYGTYSLSNEQMDQPAADLVQTGCAQVHFLQPGESFIQ